MNLSWFLKSQETFLVTLVARRYSGRRNRKPIPLLLGQLNTCHCAPLFRYCCCPFFFQAQFFILVYIVTPQELFFILQANIKLRDNISSTKDLQTPLFSCYFVCFFLLFCFGLLFFLSTSTSQDLFFLRFLKVLFGNHFLNFNTRGNCDQSWLAQFCKSLNILYTLSSVYLMESK